MCIRDRRETPKQVALKQAPAEAQTGGAADVNNTKATPVAEAIIADKKIDKQNITPSGTNGRIFKQDVLAALNNPGRNPEKPLFSREDRPEKMSSLRKTISRRLVEAKNSTAMLLSLIHI